MIFCRIQRRMICVKKDAQLFIESISRFHLIYWHNYVFIASLTSTHSQMHRKFMTTTGMSISIQLTNSKKYIHRESISFTRRDTRGDENKRSIPSLEKNGIRNWKKDEEQTILQIRRGIEWENDDMLARVKC